MKGGRHREIETTCRLGKVWTLTLLPNVSERHVTVYAREITAQKKSERTLQESKERFRQLADAMPQLVWTAAPDGRVDYFNRRLKEFKSLERMRPVIHPKDLPRTSKVWQRGIKTGRDYEIEHRMQRADGSFRWFLTRALPIRDEAGCVIKWFGTSTDVDDRKQAEQALLGAQAFLGLLSHVLVGWIADRVDKARLMAVCTRRRFRSAAANCCAPTLAAAKTAETAKLRNHQGKVISPASG